MTGVTWVATELENVSRSIDRELDLCREVQSFLRRRRAIEEDYVKKLAKLYNQFRQSPVGARSKLLLDFTQNELKLRDFFGPSITDKICDPIDQTIQDIERQHKQLLMQAAELEHEAADSMNSVKKTRTPFAKLEAKLGVARPENKTKEEIKRQELAASFVNTVYTEKIPSVMKELQQVELQSFNVQKEQLQKMVSVFENFNTCLSTSLQNLSKQIEYFQCFKEEALEPRKTSFDNLSELEQEPQANPHKLLSFSSNFKKFSPRRLGLLKSAPITEKEKGGKVKQWELEDLLLNDYGVHSIKKFLESEFTIENLLFLEALDALYEIPDRMLEVSHIKHVFTTFISGHGDYMINLPSHIRIPLQNAFEEEKETVEVDWRSSIDSVTAESPPQAPLKKPIRKEIFDPAREYVFMALKNDSYPRFLKSPFYAEFLSQVEKAQRQSSIQNILQHVTYAPVFRIPLDQLMERQAKKYPTKLVPHFLETITNQLESVKGLESETIFQTSSDEVAADVKQLRMQFNTGEFDLSSVTSPQSLLGLLKLWFREMADPIISPQAHEGILMLAWDPVASVGSISRLPSNKQNLLKFLIRFLRKFLNYSEKNKLDVDAIASVFAPLIFGSSSDQNVELSVANKEKQFVLNLLNHLSCDDVVRFEIPSVVEPPVESTEPPSVEATPLKDSLKSSGYLSASEFENPDSADELSEIESENITSKQESNNKLNSVYDINCKIKYLTKERDKILRELEKSQVFVQARSQIRQLIDSIDDQSFYSRIAPRFLKRRPANLSFRKRNKEESTGEIHLRINYFRPAPFETEGSLRVEVLEARNLNTTELSHTYVRVISGRNKKRSKIVRRSNNPAYNETFEFKISSLSEGLQIKVKDAGKVTSMRDWASERTVRPLIGMASINLEEIFPGNTTFVDTWFTIKAQTENEEESPVEVPMSPLTNSPPPPVSPMSDSHFSEASPSTLSSLFQSSENTQMKQELKLLLEKIEFEAQKYFSKINKLISLNAEINKLLIEESEMKEEFQQMEQTVFVKAIAEKNSLFEKEKRNIYTQQQLIESQQVEMAKYKSLVEEKLKIIDCYERDLRERKESKKEEEVENLLPNAVVIAWIEAFVILYLMYSV